MTLFRSSKTAMIAADITLLLVAAIWGGGFIAAKEALTTMTPFGILSTRFLLSSAVLLILFFPAIRICSKKDIQFGVIIGIIQYISFMFQLKGLALTTVEKQSFLVTAYVIFVPFFSWIATRKAIRRRDILCALLAFVGLGLLCLHSGNFMPNTGDMLSLSFAVGFAVQIVYVGNFVKNANIFAMTCIQFLTTGLLALPFLDVSGLLAADTAAIYGIAYLVIFNTAFAFSAQNIAQQYTTDSHASLLISLESVFGFLLAVWFYQDAVTLQELCGCTLMMTAIILSKLSGKS